MSESSKEKPILPRFHALMVCALFALVASVYARTVTFEFVDFDDSDVVYENPHIRDGVTAQSIYWAITSFQYVANWFPVTWFSHMLDIELYGFNPAGHHLTSLLLHALNSALLYGVLFSMTRAALPSALVAALFAVHPQHVETVAWVSERKGVLSTTFWLLATAAYVRYTRAPNVARYAPIIALLILGLMTKPMLLTLPFVFLLLDYWPLERIRLDAPEWKRTARRLFVEKTPLIVCAFGTLAIFLGTQQRGGALRSVEQYPIDVRIANALTAYAGYLYKTVWPADLTMLYPHPGDSLSAARVTIAGLLLLAVTAAAVWQTRRRPYLLVAWLWFVGTLIPVSQLVQLGAHAMADRYTYVPHIGLFIAVVWLARDAVHRFRIPRAAAVTAAAAVAIACTVAAFRQTGYWRDSETLYAHALAVTENNRLVHNNYGHLLMQRGEAERAIQHYERALSIEPDYISARMNYGAALLTQGRWNEAAQQFFATTQIDPGYAPPYTNLGNIYMRNGQFEEALRYLHRAVELAPSVPENHNSLGACYYQMGDYEKAAESFKNALALNPNYAKARRNLAAAQAKL